MPLNFPHYQSDADAHLATHLGVSVNDWSSNSSHVLAIFHEVLQPMDTTSVPISALSPMLRGDNWVYNSAYGSGFTSSFSLPHAMLPLRQAMAHMCWRSSPWGPPNGWTPPWVRIQPSSAKGNINATYAATCFASSTSIIHASKWTKYET